MYSYPAAMINTRVAPLRNLLLRPTSSPLPRCPGINRIYTCSANAALPDPPTAPIPTHLFPVVPTPPLINPAQRSEEWFALRKDRLTTSTFSTALGFWSNRRLNLWRAKVYCDDDFDTIDTAARSAMNWGVCQEATAIERYKSIRGRDVDTLGFKTHDREEYGWLGASPDGLIPDSPESPESGILEVKCPYNKGKPELGLPWATAPYYYMPQLQGQMEILGREWVDLYCWTPNASTIFRVYRDREYWEVMYGILREFWWESVLPARQALLMGTEEVKRFEPEAKHKDTKFVIARSIRLAGEARLFCKEIAGHLEFYK